MDGAALFGAFLIGENALVVECAELLLARGHRVTGIASPSAAVRDWARDRGIPVCDVDAGLVEFAAREPFDYLISAANPRMLPPAVLDLPAAFAINFHDGPLPRDAGVHAATWAVLDGRSEHGVTWHVMTARADAGDVLRQRAVVLRDNDTSHTANLRCLAAGVDSFAELVDDLATGQVSRVPQDPRLRTYHARWARPVGALLLSWTQPARELDALVRACEFGSDPNGFGTVKLALDGEIFVVRAARLGAAGLSDEPGTVISVTDDELTVSTVDGELVLTELSTVDGDPVRVGEVAARFAPGDRLAELNAAVADRLATAFRAALPNEAFWLGRLRDLNPLDVPCREASGAAPTYRSMAVAVPRERDADVLPALLAFLWRVCGETGFDIGLRRDTADDAVFARTVPFRVPDARYCGLREYRGLVGKALGATLDRGTYLRDAVPRNGLRAPVYPIVVEVGEGLPDPDPGTVLLIRLGGSGWTWVADESVLGSKLPDTLVASFEVFLRGLDAADLADIPLVDGAVDGTEDRVLLWPNETARDLPVSCVHDMISAVAAGRPQAPAVRCADTVLSYGELDRRASVVAGVLAGHGIGRGARVGVYLRRSVDLPVALLGVLKTGAAYVPLDPGIPPARVAHLMADAMVALVVTHSSLEAEIPVGAPGVLAMDRISPDAEALEPAWMDGPAGPEDLAYVSYASGSTGQQQGVRVRHRGLANLLCAMADRPGVPERNTMLAGTTPSVDTAALDLFLPLITGGLLEITTAVAGHQAEVPDLAGEVALPRDLVFGRSARAGEPGSLFLTGATGFLGAFLLTELLRDTAATVYCLVRCEDATTGMKRLRRGLEAYGLWQEEMEHRVVAVPGDLRQLRFGLPEDRFAALAERVEAVYHLGAEVNAVQPYATLRPVNAAGTLEALRLAAPHGAAFHHVSTNEVFAHPARHTVADEDSPTGPLRGLRGGYAQSKWVAEGLVRLAGRRGLPTVTYRPSRLSGDRRTGACQADDLLWRVLAGCVAAKAAPGDVTASYDVVPVDVAAAAIAVLSRTEPAGGQVYHLTNTRRLGFGTAVGYLRDLGYPLVSLSLDTWAALVRSDPANPANPVLDLFLAELTGGGWSDLVLDNTRTAHALAAAGLHCPEIGYDLFAANAGFFVRTGFLPGPGDLRP